MPEVHPMESPYCPEHHCPMIGEVCPMEYILSRFGHAHVVDFVPGIRQGRSSLLLVFSNTRSLTVGWPYSIDMLQARPHYHYESIPRWHLPLALDEARLFSITFLSLKTPVQLLQLTSDVVPHIQATLALKEIQFQVMMESEPEIDFDEDED